MSRLASTGELSEPVYFFRLRRYEAPGCLREGPGPCHRAGHHLPGRQGHPGAGGANAQFLDTKRAEAVQDAIDKINGKIQALKLARAELTEKLNSYKAA